MPWFMLSSELFDDCMIVNVATKDEALQLGQERVSEIIAVRIAEDGDNQEDRKEYRVYASQLREVKRPDGRTMHIFEGRGDSNVVLIN